LSRRRRDRGWGLLLLIKRVREERVENLLVVGVMGNYLPTILIIYQKPPLELLLSLLVLLLLLAVMGHVPS